MSTTYTISELAKEFGVTTRAIRFYEDKGLISPTREGQKRIFSKRDRTRLKLIIRGKSVGLSLNESQKLIDLYDHGSDNRIQLQKLLETIEAQKHQLSQKRTDLDEMEAALVEVEDKCRKALAQHKH